ncbi:MAG: hypothetical protein L3K07_00375 [Thermoplasmata archaeon]|nr:hypothetical protein [Thermoplasmata archaeon]
MHLRPRSRGASRTAPAGTFAVLLVAVLFFGPLFFAGARADAPSYNSTAYNSGAIRVLFPSDVPSVELVQDANPSVDSVLGLAHVLELAPLNGTHPIVELAANPESTSAFNVTQSGGVGRFDLGLNGTLGVRYAGLPLWAGSNLESIAANPSKGHAELSVSYGLLPPTAGQQGIALNWSIVNWPWQSSSDLLGIEMQFSFPNGTGFSSCPGSVTPVSCSGATLAPGGIVWSSSTTGSVGATGPGGSQVTLSWNSAARASNRSVGVTAGTFYANSSVDRVTLASSGKGSSSVNGSARFLLTLPAPLLPRTVSGSAPVYLGAIVAASVLAGAGLLLARRRDRRIARTL